MSLFIGRRPGDTVHISAISPKFVDGGGAEELLQALTFASAMKWISFDGEQVTLLEEGFTLSRESRTHPRGFADKERS